MYITPRSFTFFLSSNLGLHSNSNTWRQCAVNLIGTKWPEVVVYCLPYNWGNLCLKIHPHHSVENHSICLIWIFEFWHFQPIFVQLKLTGLVTLFDSKLKIFKIHQNWSFLAFLMNFCPPKKSYHNFGINFCPIKNYLSGNTAWLQTFGFQKLAKMDHFWHFCLTFINVMSLASLAILNETFLWFSNPMAICRHHFCLLILAGN